MSSLEWYWKRLSLMSVEEIGYRARTAARQWLQWPWRGFPRQPKPLSQFFRLTERDLDAYRQGPRPVKFLALRHNRPPAAISRQEAVALAEELLAHRVSFFDLDREPLGDPIRWNYNYKYRRMSPMIYAPRINYRDERLVGDVKYIWELNRHQHLVLLAKAYHLTGDERYAAEVVAQISSWIKQCPYLIGINWTTAEQAGIRLISWLWAYEWIRSATCVTPAFLHHFLFSVYQHVEFIARNYSRHSSANNHLIAEATGVFLASVYFPEMKTADRRRAQSQAILIEQALQQTHPDGVNREQATAYHCLVLEYLILAGVLGEQNGFRFPPSYWQRVEKMMEVVAALMDCRGQLPDLGDNDDGAVVVLGPPPASRARSILATGAVLFGRDDFRALASDFDERTYWLLGVEASSPEARSHAIASRPSRAFEQGGYYVMRSGSTPQEEVVAVFDCGPLGYGSLAAHGHADALSLTLTVAGREILIDPGTYVYHSQPKWRNYFRGTSAHNTIRIDGQDQSIIAGNFMWSHKAKAVLECWQSCDAFDLVRGHHDGYLRLSDPVRHRREVAYDKKRRRFRIVDTIQAKGRHLIEQFFHFSEACQVRRDGQQWLIENDGVQVSLSADPQLRMVLVRGQEDLPLGWRSRRLGHRQPSPTLAGLMVSQGTCVLVTIMTIMNSGQ